MDSLPENNVWCREYVGQGIERVYAARLSQDDSAVLVICRCDGSYVEVNPSGKGTQRASMHVSGDDV